MPDSNDDVSRDKPISDYRFEIAISFAGDNKRDFVRKVAELLRDRLGEGKVFFDEWYLSEIAGPDAQLVLQDIYRRRTFLVVSCVCKRYNEKPWTQEEWRAILAFERDLRDASSDNVKRMRFLPLRFGDGEIDGLLPTAIVPDVRDWAPEKIAEFILKRLDLAKGNPSPNNVIVGRSTGIATLLLQKFQLDDSGRSGFTHAGMGIVIDPYHVITCAHVVNVALGRDPASRNKPQEEVSIVFPFGESQSPIQGRVEEWNPANGQPDSDVAIIRLDANAPLDIGIAPVAEKDLSDDLDRIMVYGIGSTGKPALMEGVFVQGEKRYEKPVVGVDPVSVFTEGVFDGAAVWNMAHGKVVGMLSTKIDNQKKRVAFMIPVSILPRTAVRLPNTHPSGQTENHVLISTETPFVKLVRDALGRNLHDLGIARDFYGDRHQTFINYHRGWTTFLEDDNAKWLFTNHPEISMHQQFTEQDIEKYVRQLLNTKKKVVFFESGQEFLRMGEKLTRGSSQKNPVTVIKTDSRSAIKEMMEKASREYYFGRRRQPLCIVLIPGPRHPTAEERRDCYLEFALNLVQHSMKTELETPFGPDDKFPFMHFFTPSAVTLFATMLPDWKRENANKIVTASLQGLRQHCLNVNNREGSKQFVGDSLLRLRQHCPNTDYLFLCGNDDIALGAHDAICAYKERRCGDCGETRTVLVGFDGLEEMKALVEQGKAITARANLEDMVRNVCELVRTDGGLRPMDGRIPVSANVIFQDQLHYSSSGISVRPRTMSNRTPPIRVSSADKLQEKSFPLKDLNDNPISAIELSSAKTEAGFRGACTQRCLGCCASAIDRSSTDHRVFSMTPKLMQGILVLVEDLIGKNIHILSRKRLNLCSGSNELDHEFCTDIREQVSALFDKHYNFPLGRITSNVAFRASSCSPHLLPNLSLAMNKPYLWNQICISIDEQVPFINKNEYDSYLEALNSAWQRLSPALKCDLDDPRNGATGQPRVVINLLIPPKGSTFVNEFVNLYQDGPKRAVSYSQLIERYVTKFVGDLEQDLTGKSDDSGYSSGTGRLQGIPGSNVIVSRSWYEMIGRAKSLIRLGPDQSKEAKAYSDVRIKIHPAGESQFVVQASSTPTDWSDSEGDWLEREMPTWVEKMREFVIDTQSLSQSKQPTPG